MMTWSAVAMTAMLFVAGVASSPAVLKMPARELLPPKVESETGLPTELMPPPEDKTEKKVPFTLFLINVFAVKNFSAEESNDVLHNDVIKEIPDDIAEPLAMFLLIVEDENESKPVSLDEVAKDLVDEGFTIEKVSKNGETRLLKVDLDSVESKSELEDTTDKKIEGESTEAASEVEQTGKLMKLRRKRSACLGCKMHSLREKRHLHRHHGHGICLECNGGGFGGPGYAQPYPVQPQPIYPRPQPIYQPQPYPQPCQTCGGGGGGLNGGYGNGGGNAFATASAQASASATSGGGGYGGRY